MNFNFDHYEKKSDEFKQKAVELTHARGSIVEICRVVVE